MANYQPTYLGEIELSEESLAHYGVKGMRWRRRRGNRKNPKVDKKAVWDRSGRVLKKSSLEDRTPFGDRGLSITGVRIGDENDGYCSIKIS